MKKVAMQNLANFVGEWIKGEGGREYVRDELVSAYDELIAELNKGQAQKDKNAEAYESIHSLIVDTLSGTPVTCGELWESIKEAAPAGITKGKVQYALTHLWQDEIVKIEGKPNTYRRA